MSGDQLRWLKECRDFIALRERMEKDMRSSTQAVTAVREHFGISLCELARRLKLTAGYLSRVQDGSYKQTFELSARLFDLLTEK